MKSMYLCMLNNGTFLVLMLRFHRVMDLSAPKEEGVFDNFRREKGLFSVVLSLRYSKKVKTKVIFFILQIK